MEIQRVCVAHVSVIIATCFPTLRDELLRHIISFLPEIDDVRQSGQIVYYKIYLARLMLDGKLEWL